MLGLRIRADGRSVQSLSRPVQFCVALIGTIALMLMSATALRANATRPPARLRTDTLSKILPFSKADTACRQLAGITTPPPPMGRLVVGTLDRKTGIFTWNPAYFIRAWIPPRTPFQPGPWLTPIVAVLQHIPPVSVNVTPWVTIPPDPLVVNGVATTRPVQLAGTQFSTSAAGAAPVARSAPHTGTPPQHGVVQFTPVRLAAKQITPGVDSAIWLPVNGGPQELVFQVVNLAPGDQFTVGIGDNNIITAYQSSASASLAGTAAVAITVPLTSYAYFTLTITHSPPVRLPLGPSPSGAQVSVIQRFGSYVVLARPPVIGCFTLQAYPVAMVYEPPGALSSQTYGISHVMGTNVRTFSSSDSSANQPVNTPFSEVGDVIKAVGLLGEGLSTIGASNPWAKAAGTAMQTAAGVLKAVWGQSTTTQTIDERVSTDHSLDIREGSAQTLSTQLHLGPGRGDVIQFLTKPVFLWLAFSDLTSANVYVTVSLISYQGITETTAEALRRDTVLAIPDTVQRLILQDDPVAAEYRSAFPQGEPGRLMPNGTVYNWTGGLAETDTLSHTVSRSDARTVTITRNLTTTEQSGLFGMLGLPGPRTGTTSMTSVSGGTTGTASDSSTAVIVVLSDTGVATVHNTLASYDTKFGTFLYQELPVGDQLLSGTVTDSTGAPMVNARIELLTSTMRYVTWTDRRGTYAFRPSSLPRGNYTLVAGRHRQTIAYAASPLKVNLVLAPRSR